MHYIFDNFIYLYNVYGHICCPIMPYLIGLLPCWSLFSTISHPTFIIPCGTSLMQVTMASMSSWVDGHVMSRRQHLIALISIFQILHIFFQFSSKKAPDLQYSLLLEMVMIYVLFRTKHSKVILLQLFLMLHVFAFNITPYTKKHQDWEYQITSQLNINICIYLHICALNCL